MTEKRDPSLALRVTEKGGPSALRPQGDRKGKASWGQKRIGLRVTEKRPFVKLRASALERQKWRDPSFCAKLERKKEFFEQLRLFLTKLTLKIKI